MKKNAITLACALALLAPRLFSQQPGGTTITVYEPFKATTDSVVARTYNSCLKWNWSLVPRGAFHLSYERRINDYLSVEPGLGLTHVDYVYELVSETIEELEETATVKPGFSAELGLRFYPGEMDAFEGFYTSLGVRYRSYNIYDSDDESLGYNFLERFFMVGFQAETYWDNVMNDYYIGLSWNTLNYTEREYDTYDASGNPLYTYSSKSSTFPFIIMGTKIGFSF